MYFIRIFYSKMIKREGGKLGIFDVVGNGVPSYRNKLAGLKIKPSINILNNNGINFMIGINGNTNPFQLNKYFEYLYYFEYNIPEILDDPLTVLNIGKKHEGKVVATQLFDQENLETLLTNDINIFDFHKILNLALGDEDKVSEIIGYLNGLNEDLKYDNRLSSVCFISQANRPARCRYCSDIDANPYNILNNDISFNISETSSNEKVKKSIITNNKKICKKTNNLKKTIDSVEETYESLKSKFTQTNLKKYENDMAEITNKYGELEKQHNSLNIQIKRDNCFLTAINNGEINGIDKKLTVNDIKEGTKVINDNIEKLKSSYDSLVVDINDFISKINEGESNEIEFNDLEEEDF